MDSVSFARREDIWCFAATGERHNAARLKKKNVPPHTCLDEGTYSKRYAVAVETVTIMEPWEQVASPKRQNRGKTQARHPLTAQLSNMSRRAAIVEEFDDDTDLPLPSRSLPDAGYRGAIIEEIVDSDNDDDGEDSDEAPELLDHSAVGGPALQPSAPDTRVTDITPYKKCAKPDLITPNPCSYPHLGGHVFIQFTSTRSNHTELVLGGYRDPRVSGGLLAKTSQTPALASVWARYTKSTRCTRPTGRTRVACVYNGRRMVGRSMRVSEQVCLPS
jgi:hypothetical protein